MGRRFRFRRDSPDLPWIHVVGVVGDVMTSRRLPARPVIYTAFDQAPRRSGVAVVRTSGNPLGVVAGVKRAISDVNPDSTLDESRLDEWLARVNAGATIPVGSIAVFAALALLLATVGLYSVIGQAVARRTRDIGVRLALGARPHDVLAPVIGQHLTLMVVGFGAGAVGTLAVTRLVWRELVTISAMDPVMWVALLLVLAGVGLAASTAPARQAMRVDPIVALRSE